MGALAAASAPLGARGPRRPASGGAGVVGGRRASGAGGHGVVALEVPQSINGGWRGSVDPCHDISFVGLEFWSRTPSRESSRALPSQLHFSCSFQGKTRPSIRTRLYYSAVAEDVDRGWV